MYADDILDAPPGGDIAPPEVDPASTSQQEVSEADVALAHKLMAVIRGDKEHWRDDFKRMREDMQFAKDGAAAAWVKADLYVANITGRHINRKVAALYAKNPTIVPKRRPRMDFAIWDESLPALQEAMMLLEQAAMAPPVAVQDPMTGMVGMAPPPMPPGFVEAQQLLMDVQQGLDLRLQADKLGKTLETLLTYFLQEQQPIDFKTAAKQAVRRASTTGVAYLKLCFQRVMQPDLQSSATINDTSAQMEHIARLSKAEADGDLFGREADEQGLHYARETLRNTEEVILREGLVFDWPDSTSVIPDRLCKNINGFVGCRHVTIEYLYTPAEVEELFGVKLNRGGGSNDPNAYTPYSGFLTDDGKEDPDKRADGLVCVWEHYDKPSGTVYVLADGYKGFLKPPGAPDILVEGFFPLLALTFNNIEHWSCVFPPSDVSLIKCMQREYNSLRQGLRNHRRASQPRMYAAKGTIPDEDVEMFMQAEPFTVSEVNMGPGEDINKRVTALTIPGVDPNLYDISQAFQDIQSTVGASEAWFGSTGNSTATADALAQSSQDAGISSNTDDLDAFLSAAARMAGQVLLHEMSQEQVLKIAGRGAFWPQLTLAEIFDEVALEIEAGSSGRPNQAQEIANLERLIPLIIQLPGVMPAYIAKRAIRALDANVDLSEAYTEGLPSIVSANRSMQAAPADPNADPNAQGAEGGDNGPPAPGGPEGTPAAMGNNQI